ncbi:ornithine aminotransferase [Prevotella bivia DNF00320]|jgi:hypothetical protein|uniref:Ornithine aminotransferase n=1 Tax=Prevotella bivia DNF00320 TaxID=1401068 RepID=A0A096BM49_9BACT|nr:ornithine aminotransferase [Prevotella bivia DNF00320]
MYIDRDRRGIISINELSESELILLHKALQAYSRCNFGYVNRMDCARIWKFEREFNSIMKHEK